MSAAIIFCTLFAMPQEGKSIGVSVRTYSSTEINSLSPRYVYRNAPTINPHVYKIFMTNNSKMIPLIYMNEHILKKLRAGYLDSTITAVAIGLLVCVMFQLAGVVDINAFELIAHWNAPHPPRPGITPTVSPSSTQIAVIPTKAKQFNDMLLEFNEPKENTCIVRENGFIMSAEEAEKLISKTYPGYLEVIEDFKISDRQAAKHIYHANGMGIKPQDYGFTQQELELSRGEDRYQEGGLGA